MDTQGANLTNTSPLLLPQEENGKFKEAPITQKSPVNYCLYARKSSEDDERQALSIDSQIKEVTSQAEIQGLNIVEVRQESHSAKSTGQRLVFNQLLLDIKRGYFEGILAWAPDRLSRNAGDLGAIVDLMDNGYLKEIRTHGQVFTNSPNDKFLLMILCSQAKLENDNRGVNVRRGMRAKCEMGYRPCLTPLGYLNDQFTNKGQKKIYPDPERAPIIKEAFEKIAHEGWSGRRVFLWFRDEKNFRTRTGKPITLSGVYRMLENPYYTGVFESPVGSGKWYRGAYEPIVSKELFKAAQEKMIVPPKSMPGTKIFNFTKLLKCGSCGSGITAQEKVKRSGARYIYYHCTKLKDHTCHEPYVREDLLSEEFVRVLSELSIEQLKSNKDIYQKFEHFQKFRSSIIDFELKENQVNEIDLEGINLQKFVEYVFEKGSREEKRSLIGCLDKKLFLKDKQIAYTC